MRTRTKLIIGGKVEGFWLVQFTGVQGWGGGAVTLIGGQLFGGDSGFFYTGSYKTQNDTLNARIHVRRYIDSVATVMGRDEFDLELTGIKQGNTITITGAIPGTSLRLKGTLVKQGNLPAAA